MALSNNHSSLLVLWPAEVNQDHLFDQILWNIHQYRWTHQVSLYSSQRILQESRIHKGGLWPHEPLFQSMIGCCTGSCQEASGRCYKNKFAIVCHYLMIRFYIPCPYLLAFAFFPFPTSVLFLESKNIWKWSKQG